VDVRFDYMTESTMIQASNAVEAVTKYMAYKGCKDEQELRQKHSRTKVVKLVRVERCMSESP